MPKGKTQTQDQDDVSSINDFVTWLQGLQAAGHGDKPVRLANDDEFNTDGDQVRMSEDGAECIFCFGDDAEAGEDAELEAELADE